MRTVRVWIDDDFVEFEVDSTQYNSEDELYEAVVTYVYEVLSIEIL